MRTTAPALADAVSAGRAGAPGRTQLVLDAVACRRLLDRSPAPVRGPGLLEGRPGPIHARRGPGAGRGGPLDRERVVGSRHPERHRDEQQRGGDPEGVCADRSTGADAGRLVRAALVPGWPVQVAVL